MLEVEKVLSIPKTVFAGIKALKNKKIKKDLLEEELTRIKDRLRALDKEQEQLLQWALSGFTKETIIRENEKINQIRDELKKHSRELEASLKSTKQEKANIEDIRKAYELVSKNLTKLSFENKRLALEALNIDFWINRENIRIEGAIPMGAIVTTQSLPHLSHAHPPFP